MAGEILVRFDWPLNKTAPLIIEITMFTVETFLVISNLVFKIADVLDSARASLNFLSPQITFDSTLMPYDCFKLSEAPFLIADKQHSLVTVFCKNI